MDSEGSLGPDAIDEHPLVYFADGDPAARIGLTMSFFFGAPGLINRRRALVRCIEQYVAQATGMLRLYAVDGDRGYRKLQAGETVDPAALEAMVGPERELEFEASGAEREGVSHSWSVSAVAESVDRPTYLGYLLLTYPLRILVGAPPRSFTRQFVSICDALEVEHAYGGYGLILPFDVGGTSAAHKIIGEVAMRFPGLDVAALGGTKWHCENGIKCVSFLTAVSDRLLAAVGGAAAVAARAGTGIEVHRYRTGAVFQAGPVPQIGDATQGLVPDRYVALGRALKPIRAAYPDTLLADPAGGDGSAFTQRWLGRFDGQGVAAR